MPQQPTDSNRSMVVVAVGGDPAATARLPEVRSDRTTVVAVDGGLDWLFAAGWRADHVVGDLDSASPEAVREAEAQGSTVTRHLTDKDATDLELALDLVVEHDLGDVVLVVGPGGGRLDHLLADILAISGDRLDTRDVTAHLGAATVTVVRPGEGQTIDAVPGEQVSLLPVHGPARGVTTTGLRWPLTDADLRAGTTRAMSNEASGGPMRVRLSDGALVVIQPGTRAADVTPRSSRYDPTPRGVFDDR